MYQFTDDCRIGIPEIDQEHEHLFSLVNEGYQLLADASDLRSAGLNLLKHLINYANTHFAHEESYMKKIGDPELSSQQQEHQDFTNYMHSIDFNKLTNAQLEPAFANLLDYLSRWLFRHIIGSDTLIGKFESPFAFTSKYMTGIDLIDHEHRRLFQLIKEANDVIHAELLHDKYDEIVKILDGLREYTKEHFTDEENYMEEIAYPGLDAQLAAHTAFIDKLNEINLDDLDDNQQEYLENLIHFLLNWLSVHILHMDKAIADYAATLVTTI